MQSGLRSPVYTGPCAQGAHAAGGRFCPPSGALLGAATSPASWVPSQKNCLHLPQTPAPPSLQNPCMFYSLRVPPDTSWRGSLFSRRAAGCPGFLWRAGLPARGSGRPCVGAMALNLVPARPQAVHSQRRAAGVSAEVSVETVPVHKRSGQQSTPLMLRDCHCLPKRVHGFTLPFTAQPVFGDLIGKTWILTWLFHGGKGLQQGTLM